MTAEPILLFPDQRPVEAGPPAAVTILGLSQHYGRFPALHEIDLNVRRGEFLALLGPSGSGKTTLLRTIAGLEPNYTGGLFINGEDMRNRAARSRNIGFMFQSYALFRHMTVAENIAFGLRVLPRDRRPADKVIRDRVQELLDLVQLPELGKRFPGQISGGQRQRVALARALATEPKLLLLDEPFGALDPLVRKELRAWLRGLHERLGLTSVFVTHDQEEAQEMADRIVVLKGGVIQQAGSALELENNPNNGFVFSFLGESSRFGGRVEGGLFRFDLGSLTPVPTSLPQGKAELLSRPYQIRLLPSPNGEAVVTAVNPAGPLWRHRLQIEDASLEVLEYSAFPAGLRVNVKFERPHLFKVG